MNPAHQTSIVYSNGKLNISPPATPLPYSWRDLATERLPELAGLRRGIEDPEEWSATPAWRGALKVYRDPELNTGPRAGDIFPGNNSKVKRNVLSHLIISAQQRLKLALTQVEVAAPGTGEFRAQLQL